MPSMKGKASRHKQSIVKSTNLPTNPLLLYHSHPQSPTSPVPPEIKKSHSTAVSDKYPTTETMRLLFLTTLLALLATLVLASDTIDCRSSNRNGEKNRDIVQAINALCGWTWDLVRSTNHPFTLHTSPQPLPIPITPITLPSSSSFPSLTNSFLATDRPQRQSQVRRLQQERPRARQH